MSWSIVRLVVAASALVLVTASCALAQAGSSREAPVGHRQPKASEVPQEQQQLSDPDKKMKELDDALAKKLKGICRPGVHAVNALQEKGTSGDIPLRGTFQCQPLNSGSVCSLSGRLRAPASP
jgi:hypothetical protein